MKTLRELVRSESLTVAQEDALRQVLDDYEQLQVERKLFLIVGEICEAHEELRSGKREVYYNESNPKKPEGFPVELADAQIRLWDVQELLGHDGEYLANLKHEYNETRPYKHGRLF